MLMRLVLFTLSWIILLSACTAPHKRKGRENDIIPKEDMIHILEDIHIANGFFSMSDLRKEYTGTDSISNYRDIIVKYGYSPEDFKKTVNYYTDHLEEYEIIYEEVIKDLKEMQEKMYDNVMLTGEMKKKKKDGNMWTLKTEWHLPREGQRNKIPFSVKVDGPGVYMLSMRIRLGKNDGSRRPFISAYFWYNDSTKEGHRIFWKKKRLKKTGDIYKQYILSKELKDTLVTHLKGFLLDDENNDTLYIKHADIKDINLNVKPFDTGESADTTKNKK